jgi:hypothetical protein
MARFAAGKYAYGISDRSGFRYRLSDMRVEWNGFLVGKDEWEPKHPQLEPRRTPTDAEAIRNSRPDRVEPAVESLLRPNSFKSGSSGSAVITVTEPSHGRTTGDTVRFRDVVGFDGFTKAVIESASGYTITVVNVNTYTFTASSGTATVGNVKGGGKIATAGPVTVSA